MRTKASSSLSVHGLRRRNRAARTIVRAPKAKSRGEPAPLLTLACASVWPLID